MYIKKNQTCNLNVGRWSIPEWEKRGPPYVVGLQIPLSLSIGHVRWGDGSPQICRAKGCPSLVYIVIPADVSQESLDSSIIALPSSSNAQTPGSIVHLSYWSSCSSCTQPNQFLFLIHSFIISWQTAFLITIFITFTSCLSSKDHKAA